MRSGSKNFYISQIFLLSLSLASIRFGLAAPSFGSLSLPGRSTEDLSLPLVFYEAPAPSPEDGPPGSANALRDSRYLPAQIGGIIGSYAFSLVLVATLLLVLSGRRREHFQNRELDYLIEPTFDPFPEGLYPAEWTEEYQRQLRDFAQSEGVPGSPGSPRSFYRNFSLPINTSPISPTKSVNTVTFPSPTSTHTQPAPGVDLTVDQLVVQQDREMAQQQLEDMYKFVMEHEDAKKEGREYEGPPLTSPSARSLTSSAAAPMPAHGVLKKEKSKPSSLNLAKEEKKGSSFLSMLKSPRRNKAPKGISISSPVSLTPLSATFPRHEDQEMNHISPRHYNPPPPPPVPTGTLPFRKNSQNLPTPDVSPDSTQSIDERIDATFGKPRPRPKLAPIATVERRSRDTQETSRRRDKSANSDSDGEGDRDRELESATDPDPVSTVSDKSTSGLVGLPTSPKPGVNRFPSLASLPSVPASPRSPGMGMAFQRINAPQAIRTGGALPLRAYEPGLASPSMASQTTKQTVFTRVGPLSPHGMRTPFTGAPVPYTPYQPFSPVVPITPSLVTREDRKRMRRLEPKTPTVEMVKSSDDLW